MGSGLPSRTCGLWQAVPEPADWVPHVSVAYSRVSRAADVYEAALGGEDATADVTIGAVQLIVLGRDEQVYEWSEYAEVRVPSSHIHG